MIGSDEQKPVIPCQAARVRSLKVLLKSIFSAVVVSPRSIGYLVVALYSFINQVICTSRRSKSAGLCTTPGYIIRISTCRTAVRSRSHRTSTYIIHKSRAGKHSIRAQCQKSPSITGWMMCNSRTSASHSSPLRSISSYFERRSNAWNP